MWRPKQISELVLKMAKENPSWGYTRIVGALANLGYEVGRGTVANIMKEHGLEPTAGLPSATWYASDRVKARRA